MFYQYTTHDLQFVTSESHGALTGMTGILHRDKLQSSRTEWFWHVWKIICPVLPESSLLPPTDLPPPQLRPPHPPTRARPLWREPRARTRSRVEQVQQDAVKAQGLRAVRSVCGKRWDEVKDFTDSVARWVLPRPRMERGEFR